MAEQNPPVDANKMHEKHEEQESNARDAATKSGNPNDPRWKSADKLQEDNAEKLGEERDSDKDDKSGGR